MAVTRTDTVDKIVVRTPYYRTTLRTKVEIKDDDGNIVASSFSQVHVVPGRLNDSNDALVDTDISGYSADVQAVLNAIWTAEVKEAWKNELISRL